MKSRAEAAPARNRREKGEINYTRLQPGRTSRMKSLHINTVLFTLSNLDFRDIVGLSLNRLGSLNHYYQLKKRIHPVPAAAPFRPPITISKMEPSDVEEIVRIMEGLDGTSKKEIITRLMFYHAGFKSCYLAKTRNNEIAYLQWLVFPSENEVIRKYFPRRFYPLDAGEVMIENAFTFPKFRGLGLMPAVTQELIRMAREAGYTAAVTYIRKDKIASLNTFMKLGFKITKLIKEYKFFGVTVRML